MVREKPSSVRVNIELDRINRRKFVAALIGAGYSIGSALALTPNDVAATKPDEVPIVVGASRGDEQSDGPTLHKKTVPARWYDRLSAARKIHREFQKGAEIAGYTEDTEALSAIWVHAGSVDEQRPFIEIEATDVEENIPLGYNEHEGVPIKITPVTEQKIDADVKKPDDALEVEIDPEDTSLRGGDRCGDGDGSYGTLGTALAGRGVGEPRYFLACEHIGAESYSRGFTEGDLLYRNESSSADVIGEVVEASCSDDIAIAEPKNGYKPEFKVRGESDEVTGIFYEDGLADYEGEDVEKYGQRTGHTSGEVKAHNGTVYIGDRLRCPRRTGQLKWGTSDDSNDGDSGSPVYADPTSGDPDDRLWIAGGVDGGWPEFGPVGDYTFVTAAWKIYDEYDYLYWVPPWWD